MSPNPKNPKRVGSAEAEIIRRAQHGDAEAFEQIYQLYSRRIYALCLRIVRNPTETEDLAQEAFLRVFRKILRIPMKVIGVPG
jgi:RNA polymerase sigma-70 factor, ECF subfamily